MRARCSLLWLVSLVSLGSAERLAAGASSVASVSPTAVDLGSLDRAIDPCADFDAYANAAWRTAFSLPEGEVRWSRRQAARAIHRGRLTGMLESLAAVTKNPSSPVDTREQHERLLGDFYASCLDEAAAESAGLAPLEPLLRRIRGVESSTDLGGAIRELHDLDVRVPFGVVAGYDFRAPERTIAHVVAGDPPLRPAGRSVIAETARWTVHVTRALERSGVPKRDAIALAPEVLALDARLAAPRLPEDAAADPATVSHPTSFAELVRLAPNMDWNGYFDHAGLARIDLNVAETEHLRAIDRELEATPLAVWKGYLALRLIDAAAPWLSRELADERRRIESPSDAANAAGSPRGPSCVALTESLLGDPLGRAFAERHFPPASKRRVEEAARRILESYREAVASLDWPSDALRAEALAKLATYDVAVGYPDAWRDLSELEIDRAAAPWTNVAAARRQAVHDARRRIGRATDRDVWGLAPSSAGAYLDIQPNLMVLPAGFLQPPAFDPEASDAVLYGAIGAGLAHDVLHAIDPLGAAFDARGRARDWWTDVDRKQYSERTQCVLDQASAFEALPGVPLDGPRVLGEALGDLVGLRIAFAAMESSMRTRPIPDVGGLTPAQQFFVAWAQFRGANESPDWLRKAVASDSHPAARFRVNAPVALHPAFAPAFACTGRDEAARASLDRCSVWLSRSDGRADDPSKD